MDAISTLELINSRRDPALPLVATTALGRLSRVRFANNFMSRCIGLLNRSGLADDEGLLFAPGGSIHTLGMRFAIDVVFLDARFTVLQVQVNVKPWRFALAPARTRFVLELGASRCKELGILVGRAIELQR